MGMMADTTGGMAWAMAIAVTRATDHVAAEAVGTLEATISEGGAGAEMPAESLDESLVGNGDNFLFHPHFLDPTFVAAGTSGPWLCVDMQKSFLQGPP